MGLRGEREKGREQSARSFWDLYRHRSLRSSNESVAASRASDNANGSHNSNLIQALVLAQALVTWVPAINWAVKCKSRRNEREKLKLTSQLIFGSFACRAPEYSEHITGSTGFSVLVVPPKRSLSCERPQNRIDFNQLGVDISIQSSNYSWNKERSRGI